MIRYWNPVTCIAAIAAELSLPASYAFAQAGTCTPALWEAYLDVNNVWARILNNGYRFWRGSPYVYEVPGAGALEESGAPPADCSRFDRLCTRSV